MAYSYSSPNHPANIYTAISFLMPDMTRTEKKIAEFFLNHSQEVVSQSLAKTARACGCGEASIVRFCRRIGYEGFTEAKELLAAQAEDSTNVSRVKIGSNDSIEKLIIEIYNQTVDTLRKTMELNSVSNFELAIQKLAVSRNIYLLGIGDALVPCQCAYYRFRRIGIGCYYSEDADMQVINISNATAQDAVIAVSHSGMTRHVNTALKVAHEAGAFTIGITQSAKSQMTSSCDLIFFNATADMTIGKTIVAQRTAENTIMEVLYAGVVSLNPQRAHDHLKASADNLKINKLG